MTILIAGDGIGGLTRRPSLLSPARLFDLGRDFRPAHAHVIELALAHRSKLAAVADTLAPLLDDVQSTTAAITYRSRQRAPIELWHRIGISAFQL